MRYLALILVLLGMFAGGCRRQQPEAPEQLEPESYGELPGLKGVQHAELRDELARITEDGGTPELLSKTKVAEADNVAAGLRGLFPEHKALSIRVELEAIFPPEKFEFDPARLQEAIRVRKEYDSSRLQARDALKRPQCDFGIRFMAGSLAELKFVDVVWICAYLEAFQAAEGLSSGKPDEAIESLRLMLRLATCLGAEKHVVPRLEAAFLRTKAFVVLQAVVQQEGIRQRHLRRLYEMVEGQLTAWPSDAAAWIGDRSLGMHAYEMLRAGNLMEVLTLEETDRFKKEGILDEMVSAARPTIDQDELYYLKTMRKIIDSCKQPYHARLKLFDSIGRDLLERRNLPEFPIVAARLLLPDIEQGHAIQAQDRANWEAWAVALALATGRRLPPYRINPLSGQEYQPAQYDEFAEVRNFGSGKDGDNPSITVPHARAGASGKVDGGE